MNMYKLKSHYVAAWSLEHSCFMVTNFFRALMANRKMTIERKNTGFQIFGIYKTQDEAQAAVDEMKELQK